MVKIIFLGTAGDSSVTGRQLRASGGFVLQIGEFQIFFDPGPGALVRAKEFGINVRVTSAIIVSHNHLNHCNDLNALIDAMTLGGFDKKGVLITNPTVVNGSEKYTAALSSFHRGCLEHIIILRPEQKAAIGDAEIYAIATAHAEPDGLAFRIVTPQYTIGYSGDTAYTKDLAHALEGADILILNVTYPGDTKTDNHLNREGVVNIITQVKPKLAVITHFGFAMLKADPLLEARHIQLATGIRTIAARDGLNVTPSEYAIHAEHAKRPFKKE